MQKFVLALTFTALLALTGCGPSDDGGLLPVVIPHTVPAQSGARLDPNPTEPETHVPAQYGIAPEADRPGLAFEALPHRSTDRQLRIAWTDSGSASCGGASRIWVYETSLQIVITVYAPPTYNTDSADCAAKEQTHVEMLRLKQPVADRVAFTFDGR